MRIALAVMMVAPEGRSESGPLHLGHGIAHLVGFMGAWQLSTKIPFKTTVLVDHIDVGENGIRAIGIAWLACALAFVVVAGALAARAPWWPQLAIATVLTSLVLCVVELPAAKIGLFVNLAILTAIVLARHGGWLD